MKEVGTCVFLLGTRCIQPMKFPGNLLQTVLILGDCDNPVGLVELLVLFVKCSDRSGEVVEQFIHHLVTGRFGQRLCIECAHALDYRSPFRGLHRRLLPA